MKKNNFNLACFTLSVVILGLLCSSCGQDSKKDKTDSEITVSSTPDKGVFFIGTKEQVEETKKTMGELTDPADDIALNARYLYRQGKYAESEKESLRALSLAKHSITIATAHNTLLDIYEATKKYDLAIKEIDWLLDNVNEYAKPELLQKRAKFQELLSK